MNLGEHNTQEHSSVLEFHGHCSCDSLLPKELECGQSRLPDGHFLLELFRAARLPCDLHKCFGFASGKTIRSSSLDFLLGNIKKH